MENGREGVGREGRGMGGEGRERREGRQEVRRGEEEREEGGEEEYEIIPRKGEREICQVTCLYSNIMHN